MSLLWPPLLWSLLLLLPLVALYLRVQRRRRNLAARYGSLGRVAGPTGRSPGWRRHVPAVFFLLGLAALLVGVARPQAVVNLPRIEGTVILAFDVSGSMAADDMKPTRMEAAKSAARIFIQNQPPSVQIGIVTFSESGLAVQPPTNDQAVLLAAVNRLTPARGTSLANGILASLSVIATAMSKETTRYYTNLTPAPAVTPTPVPKGSYTPATIVLLSDGESNIPPDPLAAAQAAADRGVRIYTIGIGSAGGATVKIDGFNVFTQLDEGLLRNISQITGGAYFHAANEQDLTTIYNTLGTQLVVRPQKTEITAFVAGAGLLLLLIGGACSFVWFNRLP